MPGVKSVLPMDVGFDPSAAIVMTLAPKDIGIPTMAERCAIRSPAGDHRGANAPRPTNIRVTPVAIDTTRNSVGALGDTCAVYASVLPSGEMSAPPYSTSVPANTVSCASVR